MDTVTMMQQLLNDALQPFYAELTKLREENLELRLQLTRMDPTCSAEERTMAAQQLMELQAKKTTLAEKFK